MWQHIDGGARAWYNFAPHFPRGLLGFPSAPPRSPMMWRSLRPFRITSRPRENCIYLASEDVRTHAMPVMSAAIFYSYLFYFIYYFLIVFHMVLPYSSRYQIYTFIFTFFFFFMRGPLIFFRLFVLNLNTFYILHPIRSIKLSILSVLTFIVVLLSTQLF